MLNRVVSFSRGLLAATVVVGVAAVHAQGGVAYVPKVGRAEAAVINVSTGAVVTTIQLPNGYSGSAASPDGARVYLVDQSFNKVTVVNTQTNAVITDIPVAGQPWSAAVSPDSALVYVSTSSGSAITVISAATNSVVGSIPGVNSGYGIAITPDGSKLFATPAGGSLVSVVDTSTHAVTSIGVGLSPVHVAISPDGRRAYVTAQTGNNVTVIDIASNSAIATIPVGTMPFGVVVTPDNTRVYVANSQSNSVSVISASSLSVIATIPVGNVPRGIDVSPDGSRVLVANQVSANMSIISTSSNTVTGTVNLGDSASPFSMGRFISFAGVAPAITSAAPPDASYGQPYSHTVTATGTPAPTFVLHAGALPPGLNLDPATGVISGTPTAVGAASVGSVRASNAVGAQAIQPFSIAIAATVPDAPTIGTLTAGNGSISVTFTPPANDGGSTIWMYNAFCNFAASNPTSPIVMNNIPNGVPVRCRVNAVNGVGGGLASDYSNEVTPQAPTTMQLQTSAAIAHAGAPITFTATLDEVAASGSITFSADAQPISGCTAATISNGVAICATTFATAGTRGITAQYAGDAAHIGSAGVLAGGQQVISAPAVPLIIDVTPLDQAARITFNGVTNDGGSALLDYSASCTPGPFSVTTTSLTVDVGGLSNNVAYRCSVRARNAVGFSAPSAALSVIPGGLSGSADLSISKTNNAAYVNDGAPINYVITVSNPGPAAVIGARVEDGIGAGTDFTSATWQCSALNGAACPDFVAGSGALDALVDLPAQTSVQFLFAALPTSGVATPISNTVSLTPPANVADPDLDNNIASDGPDERGMFRDGFD
jgi:uncharacterized repeat protein (TIGR01451 family)